MCLALRCALVSLSSPEGGEGRGEEAALLGVARTPPSPALPPLVPRGERETFVECAKHIPATTPPRAAAERLARCAQFAESLCAAGRDTTRRSEAVKKLKNPEFSMQIP